MAKLTDDALLDKARRGDNEAIGKLWERYEARLRRAVCRSVPREDVEDVLGDLRVAIVSGISTNYVRNFAAWVSKVCRNRVATYFNDKKGVGTESEDDAEVPIEPPAAGGDETRQLDWMRSCVELWESHGLYCGKIAEDIVDAGRAAGDPEPELVLRHLAYLGFPSKLVADAQEWTQARRGRRPKPSSYETRTKLLAIDLLRNGSAGHSAAEHHPASNLLPAAAPDAPSVYARRELWLRIDALRRQVTGDWPSLSMPRPTPD